MGARSAATQIAFTANVAQRVENFIGITWIVLRLLFEFSEFADVRFHCTMFIMSHHVFANQSTDR